MLRVLRNDRGVASGCAQLLQTEERVVLSPREGRKAVRTASASTSSATSAIARLICVWSVQIEGSSEEMRGGFLLVCSQRAIVLIESVTGK